MEGVEKKDKIEHDKTEDLAEDQVEKTKDEDIVDDTDGTDVSKDDTEAESVEAGSGEDDTEATCTPSTEAVEEESGIEAKVTEAETEDVDGYTLLQEPADVPETETLGMQDHDDYMYYYEDDMRKSVTKSHYIHTDERSECQGCSMSVSLFSFHRPHHCRRCGEVFCKSCLIYRRRLNVWAQPDVRGILCKVCIQCYGETEVIMFGIKRSQTEYFTNLRQQCKTERRHIKCDLTIERRNGSVVPVLWREEFEVDIPRECQRLLKGFKSAVGSSEAHKTLHEMTDKFVVPAWQKAKYWSLESSMFKCRQCTARLKGKKYRNCRVCALAMCKKCSLKELLVYFEDDRPPQKDTSPKLAIIKVTGSPEKEPRYSLLLNICSFCRSDLVKRQSGDPNWFDNLSKPPEPDLMSRITEVDQTFRDLIANIHQSVERLCELGILQYIHSPTEPKATAGDKRHKSKDPGKDDDTGSDSQEVLTLKESLQSNLDKYYTVYQTLNTSVKGLMESAYGRKLNFAQNYIKARSNSYIQLRNRGSTHITEKT